MAGSKKLEAVVKPAKAHAGEYDFSAAKILVVGDVMLDSYWQGNTDRISPEAPVPVVLVNDRSWRLGGSGNVAVNIASLGAAASLLALVGDDADGRRLCEMLKASYIDDHCLVEPQISTTVKLRVLSQHQQLIRLDFEKVMDDLNIDPLLQRFQGLLESVDLVVLSDYGKGLLHRTRPFIELANQASIPVLVDPKKSNFSEYAGAYLLTPNQKEFEVLVGKVKTQAELIDKAGRVIEEFQLQGLLVTQGSKGMTLVMKDSPAEHFPAQAREVYDVTGAGDTVIAALATGLAKGMAVADAVNLSCKAAGIVVGRVGTASVSVEDLKNLDSSETGKSTPLADKIVSREDLEKIVAGHKSGSRKLVFTNGCFDLLHAGHVSYLEQASALGDVLIVAVNSDASVKKLKGAGRPINSLQDRMSLLAGLASVDYVVAFGEDTPEDLVCALRPDILVKGGDYKRDEIAGRDCVDEVVLIDFIAGKSTTSILEKIGKIK